MLKRFIATGVTCLLLLAGVAGWVTQAGPLQQDNQIKVLSLPTRDSELRIALYRAIYDWNSPLFRYAMRAMPPIHIIVENGRVTLKGAVATQLESQLASNAANHVSGIFEVRNELRIDN